MGAIVDWERDTPQWSAVLATTASSRTPSNVDNALWRLYGPIVQAPAEHAFVIGQIGQSLDGRIATASGHSHYINGPTALMHLHRLRALVDAVVVGVGTVMTDDPQLSVRMVPSRPGAAPPARVVLDPKGRMFPYAKCLAEDGARRIVVWRKGTLAPMPDGVEGLHVDAIAGDIPPQDIIAALRELGLKRILIEGGANTLSRFMAAGCLDRLHVMVAPMIIGSGPIGVQLPEIERLDAALRPKVESYTMPEGDVLFDCAFK
jgi:diaminohydroxyphosphoribosylaminopyrimidine deaminase/5-amino-6-(5-phosphoribosylamino)uracil reductase